MTQPMRWRDAGEDAAAVAAGGIAAAIDGVLVADQDAIGIGG